MRLQASVLRNSRLSSGLTVLSISFLLTACSTKFNSTQLNSAANSTSKTTEIESIVQEIVPSKLVFGQETLSDWLEGERGITTVRGVATDGTRLYVADNYWGKIMIFNSPTQDYPAMDLSLGKLSNKSFFSCPPGGVSAQALSGPTAIHIDGSRLYVADTNYNRVLIWNSLPTSNCAPADLVLGQADFNSHFANRNQANPSADSLSGPSSITTVGNKVLVSDATNNRILVWNNKNILTSGAPADVVIGQSSFTTNTANIPSRTGATLSGPQGLGTDGTRLLIADRTNRRVLIYSTVPTTSGATANYVFGQTTLGAATNNSGGLSDSSISVPRDVKVVNGKVLISDEGNHRVLIWNSVPSANKVSANVVLGQTAFNTNSANGGNPDASAIYMSGPMMIASDGSRLYVSDAGNNRVLMWDQIPTSSGTPAARVIGQPALSPYKQSAGAPINAVRGFHASQSLVAEAGRMLILSGHRVSVWNNIPTSSNTPADLVLGQPDFNSNIANNDTAVSARTLNNPIHAWTDGARIVLSDTSNNRVLIWTTFPKDSYTPADIVLGQPNFSAVSGNAGGGTIASDSGMNGPTAVTSDGTRLFVVDSSNHRVLIWNTFPTTSSTPASVVLGQPDMNSNTANNGGLSAKSLKTPRGAAVSGGKLIVSDDNDGNGNRRVLIWNQIPVNNFTPADVVLGQEDFVSNKPYAGENAHLRELAIPRGIRIENGRLYIRGNNNRIMIWNKIPTVNNTPADWIIQPSDKETSEYSVSNIYNFSVTNGKLFHSDYRGSRAIASVIHPVALYSPAETSLLQGQLSALSCNEISHIMANEGDRPSASDPGWQECSTIPGAIRFRLSSSNEGLHLVKVWMKKTKMAVKSDPITIPVYFDQTYPLPPTVKLNSSNPAVSAEVSITIGSCNSSTYAAVTETETPPTIESDAWQWCTTTAGAITHTLSSQTSSAHTLYIWGKKETGLISQANTVSVTY